MCVLTGHAARCYISGFSLFRFTSSSPRLKMLSVLVTCVVLATASAVQLDSGTLEKFQGMFYGTIMQHLDTEYKLLQPIMAMYNDSEENCRAQIATAQESCKTCAKSECEGDFGDWIEYQWGTVSYWFKGAGHSFVDWQGWNKIGGFFTGIGKGFVGWSGWGDIENFFSGFGSDIGNFVGNFGHGLKSGFKDFGNFMGNTFSGIGKLFGRKRRDVGVLGLMARRLKMVRNGYLAKRVGEISPEAEECMMKCSQCTPFLEDDEEKMVDGVCGEELLEEKEIITEALNKMKALFEANGNPQQNTKPILTMVEYDKSTFDFGTFTCGGVKVTAMTPNGPMTYDSAYRYSVEFPQTTASELAMELIQKWGL